jgi:hypothetical protein
LQRRTSPPNQEPRTKNQAPHPDLPLAIARGFAKSGAIMLTGIIIALLFLGAGVVVFTYLKKGAM